jgi:hypothetical protein
MESAGGEMHGAIGHMVWAIPEGWIPGSSTGPVRARRTLHQWLNELEEPEPIPKETDYAMLVKSDVPIVVQHTRLDSRQAENALLTTIAFPVHG